MNNSFQSIMAGVIGSSTEINGVWDFNTSKQFNPDDQSNDGIAQCLNAAFLIRLSGESHALYLQAGSFLSQMEKNAEWKTSVQFYREGLKLIENEIDDTCEKDSDFSRQLERTAEWIKIKKDLYWGEEARKKIWAVFFPEGLFSQGDHHEGIDNLRKKRKIIITRLNPNPVVNASDELLFTSNILLGLPRDTADIDKLDLSEKTVKILKEVAREKQSYWYDHPIQIGVPVSNNEAVYGLTGLNEAIACEKERNNAGPRQKTTCLLSVSVTHKGLHRIARDYLKEEFKKAKLAENIDVYIFTEVETQKIIEEILIPAAQRYLDSHDFEQLKKIFGVDGEYGRHYSFLKAISAFWKVFINPNLKGTFKIDLDQVFPQEELIRETGKSAFEHFRSPLWGALGKDVDDNIVELGMIAGALVNKRDISQSLFTPDVLFPDKMPAGEGTFFLSGLPMALSTQAELMTRYNRDGDLDGIFTCIQRFHVTGGTNGILIKCLRKYRPFTPTFIGRAEDQAYLLSVLFKEADTNLRYFHEDGLIMRHDKEAFTGEAIKAAELGRQIGDLYRILYFSFYCRSLPWSVEKTKTQIDPFTGGFVSRIPITMVYLRFTSSLAELFFHDDDKSRALFKMGTERLHALLKDITSDPNPLIKRVTDEKNGWNLYYDILDKIERDLEEKNIFALNLKTKAEEIASGSQAELGKK